MARKQTARRDPSVSTGDRFFGGNDRTRKLTELRDPAGWARRVVLVTGESGVGKTHFFRAVSCRLDAQVKAVRIIGSLINDETAVLGGIAQGLGIAPPAAGTRAALCAAITEHVREQNALARLSLLMVDDADRLDVRALDALIELVERAGEQGLRLALFAQPAFVQMLERVYRKRNRAPDWHEIRLSPLAPDEVGRYLEFQFAEAGVSEPLPFSDGQLKELARASRGLPGPLAEIAAARLRHVRASSGRGPLLWAASIPPLHRVAAAVIGGVIVVAWLLWPSAGDDARRTIALDLPAVPAQAREASAAPAPDRAAAPTAGGTAVPDGTAVPGGTATMPGAPSPAVTPAAAPAAQVSATPAPATTASAGASDTPAPAPVRSPATEATQTPAPTAAPVSAPPAQRAAPVTAAAPAPARPAPSTGIGGARDNTWLLAQPPDRWTVQLFGASNRDAVEAFIKRQSNPQAFAVVQTRRSGNPWYVVTYGDYANRQAAEAASVSLPSAVGRVEPWVRSYNAIQQEARR